MFLLLHVQFCQEVDENENGTSWTQFYFIMLFTGILLHVDMLVQNLLLFLLANIYVDSFFDS